MRKIKQVIISLVMVTMLMVTLFSTGIANAVTNLNVYNLNTVVQNVGTYCTLTSYSNAGVIGATDSNYYDSWKYVSCTSFSYNSTYGIYVAQDSVNWSTTQDGNSGYTPGAILSTAHNRLLNLNGATVKTSFYGEIHNSSEASSLKKERKWITRYKDSSQPHTMFNFEM